MFALLLTLFHSDIKRLPILGDAVEQYLVLGITAPDTVTGRYQGDVSPGESRDRYVADVALAGTGVKRFIRCIKHRRVRVRVVVSDAKQVGAVGGPEQVLGRSPLGQRMEQCPLPCATVVQIQAELLLPCARRRAAFCRGFCCGC